MELIFRSYLIVGAIMILTFGEKLDFLSFIPPFTEVDNSGSRMINRDWRISGSTVVNSNFARLTPDRQSKKGAIWSRKALGVPSFSIVFKFRISGKGKVFFGDGIALWIVQQGYYTDGDLHGFPQKFTGVGIIFDTFKNTEYLSAHRDVTVLVNDGEKTYEMMTTDVQGCNANFRYHSERADFAVTDATRVKIFVTENNITISLDPRNTGEWMDCVSVKGMALPAEWARRAHIGITGTTGQLSDNHDVMSLQTYSDFQVMEAHEAVSSSKKLFDVASDQPVGERLHRLEDAVNGLLEKLEFINHHIEHEIVTLSERVVGIHHKVEKIETQQAENAVSSPTTKAGAVGDDAGQIDTRLTVLEKQLQDAVHNKIASMESTLLKRISSGGGGWKGPFILLVIIILAAAVGLFLFYQRLKKMHML